MQRRPSGVRRGLRSFGWAVAVLPAALGLAPLGTARAQSAGARAGGAAPAPAAESSAPRVKVERTASGQKIYRITDAFVLEGRIQKPNAFYVLERSSIDYDWENLKLDFLPKVMQAASHHPF